TGAFSGTDLKLSSLQPTIYLLSFESFKKTNVQTEIMKNSFAFTLIAALALCVSQLSAAESKKNVEANRLAREGAEAAKSQDWDKAVEMLRKATAMDHKYADELATVYQQRGFASAKNQQFKEAVQDFTEALKIEPNNVRIFEQRAAVEMKMYDYEKALADYAEASKLKPNEIR